MLAGLLVASIALAQGGAGAAATERHVFSAAELEQLVGPVALYVDDLVGVVLPASAYPLQVVEAARFLGARENDPTLEPDEGWDDAVVALLNYPDVLRMMSDNLDWTAQLGEAFVYQQGDVLDAIQTFRERARTAGNLASDGHQLVSENPEGDIEIAPADPQVIYVPYYEPQSVVVRHSAPVVEYYPYGYPLYDYPYPLGYAFDSGFFWGVTTAFVVGWHTHSLHIYYHDYVGHPFYGRRYYDPYYFRRTLGVDFGLARSGHVWRPASHWGATPRHRIGGALGYVDRHRSVVRPPVSARPAYRPRSGAPAGRDRTLSSRRGVIGEARPHSGNRGAAVAHGRPTTTAEPGRDMRRGGSTRPTHASGAAAGTVTNGYRRSPDRRQSRGSSAEPAQHDGSRAYLGRLGRTVSPGGANLRSSAAGGSPRPSRATVPGGRLRAPAPTSRALPRSSSRATAAMPQARSTRRAPQLQRSVPGAVARRPAAAPRTGQRGDSQHRSRRR